MKLSTLVLALIAALGSGCASIEKARLAYEVKPDSTVRHGAPNAQSYYHLGRYYQGQKRLDMAETAYMKAISLDGRQVDAYNALGSLYAERGELERSVQQFERALQIAPRAGYVYNNLGFAYFLLGRLAEAYDAVRKALTLDATLERGWLNLERIAIGQSDKKLIATAKSRKTEALPATLLATNMSSGKISAGPAENMPAKVTVTQLPHVAEPTSDSPQSSITIADSSGVRTVTLVQSNEVQVQEVASPVAADIRPADNAEERIGERIEGGQFVLVSGSRETANLTEPLKIAKAEPTRVVPLPAKNSVPAGEPGTNISGINVEISNANGVGGFARKFGARLREDGIPVTRITNYDSFMLKGTIIEYQPGYEDAARTLMLRTRLDASLVPAKGPRARSDVRILLGRNASVSAKTTVAKAP